MSSHSFINLQELEKLMEGEAFQQFTNKVSLLPVPFGVDI
jgi:hypothetical protein